MGPNPPGPPPPGCLLVVHYWVATPTDDKTNWLLNVFIPSLFFVAVACGYSALQQFQMQQVTKVSTPPPCWLPARRACLARNSAGKENPPLLVILAGATFENSTLKEEICRAWFMPSPITCVLFAKQARIETIFK